MAGHRPPISAEEKASKKATNTTDLGMAGFRFVAAIATSSIFYLVTGGGIDLGFFAISATIAGIISASIYVTQVLLREDHKPDDPVEDWLEKNDDPLWLTNIKEMFMQDKIDVQRLERLTSLGWAGRLTDNGMRKRARLIRTYDGNELADRIAPIGRSNSSDQYIGVQGRIQLNSAQNQLDAFAEFSIKKQQAKMDFYQNQLLSGLVSKSDARSEVEKTYYSHSGECVRCNENWMHKPLPIYGGSSKIKYIPPHIPGKKGLV